MRQARNKETPMIRSVNLATRMGLGRASPSEELSVSGDCINTGAGPALMD